MQDLSVQRIRILLIEDNPMDVVLLEDAVESAVGQFEIVSAESLADGTHRLLTEKFDLVLLDLNLPDSRDIDTVLRTRSASPNIPIVVLTSVDNEAMGLRAIQAGVQDYLVKGAIDAPMLMRAVRYARERKRLEAELRRANEALEAQVRDRTEDLEKSVHLLGEEISHTAAVQDVRASHAQLLALLEALPDACLLLGTDAQTAAYCNRAYERLWGHTREELAGRPRRWLEAMHEDDRPAVQAAIDQCDAQSEGVLFEGAVRIRRPDGGETLTRCRLVAVPGLPGGALLTVAEEVPPAEAQETWSKRVMRKVRS